MSKCDDTILTEQNMMIVINRILTDKYIIIFLFIFLIIVAMFIFYYIIKEIRKILKAYYKNQGSSKDLIEDELYDDDDNDPYVINQHMDLVSGNYYKHVENNYKDYNYEKSKYITQNYNIDVSDDVIDRNILFSKQDNYEYTPTDDDNK
jgi:hypothetical protein